MCQNVAFLLVLGAVGQVAKTNYGVNTLVLKFFHKRNQSSSCEPWTSAKSHIVGIANVRIRENSKSHKTSLVLDKSNKSLSQLQGKVNNMQKFVKNRAKAHK
jgi:hypothetical protein